MAPRSSTREILLVLLDEMEMIAKRLLANMIAPKYEKVSRKEHAAIVDLLLAKDAELKKMVKVANEQVMVELKQEELRKETETLDAEISKLKNSLKDAESMLSDAIFRARQKLSSIAQANEHPVVPDELIKYANRISVSNAVSAPLDWRVGDMRRPYPTDFEMQHSVLKKINLTIKDNANYQDKAAEIDEVGIMSTDDSSDTD